MKIVLVTWDSCQHCHEMLNDVWNAKGGVKEYLTKKGYTVVHERVPAGNESKIMWARGHPELKDYVSWYPTILKYKSSGSEPEVYGAVAPGRKPRYDHQSEYNSEKIIAWIEK